MGTNPSSSQLICLLYFPSNQINEVIDLLEREEIYWTYQDVVGSGYPKPEMLAKLARVEELFCFEIKSRFSLLEELLEFIRRERNHSKLDNLGALLCEKGIRAGLALTTTNGNRRWVEVRALYGTFMKLEPFFIKEWGKEDTYPDVGIFHRSRNSDPEKSSVY